MALINRDTPEFYSNIGEKLINFANNNVIIVGDWNLLLKPEIDCLNYKKHR